MSIYRFVKDSSQPGASKRLFVQANPSGPDADSLKAVYTNKRLSTEVLGSSFESVKTSRSGEDGKKRLTTRIVRKVTTLTRGEEKSRDEELTRRADVRSIEARKDEAKRRNTETVQPKRVKVRLFFNVDILMITHSIINIMPCMNTNLFFLVPIVIYHGRIPPTFSSLWGQSQFGDTI